MSAQPDRLLRPVFRLFDPEEPESMSPPDSPSRDLWPGMTLSQFWEAFVAKSWLKERHDSSRTRAEYQKSIDYWKQFTGDPPLNKIDDFHTSAFMQAVFQLPGRGSATLAPDTADKHRRNIQTCLRLAGPRHDRAKKAQKLLPEIPYLEPVQLDDPEVDDDFTLAEISAMLAACHTMKRPRIPGVEIAHWWESLIILAYNTGERRGALLGVTYADLSFSKEKGHVLEFPRTIRKGKRKRNRVPLNEPALRAIERIRTDRDLIFPWKNWPKNTRWFEENWKRLLIAADIPEHRHFGIHSIRKTTGTAVFGLSPAASQLLMGHCDMATTLKHYVNRGIIKTALDCLPQPAPPPANPVVDPQLALKLKAARKPKKPKAPKFDPLQTDFLPPVVEPASPTTE